MNPLRISFCLLLLAAPALAWAQQSAPPPAARPAAAAESEATLPAWDQLSAEQREALVAPIRDRWNAEPRERARILEHARRWQSMPAEERERAHRGMSRFEQMDPQQRRQARVIFMHTRGMNAEEARTFRERWKKMSPEQRQQWLREHVQQDAPPPKQP